MNNLPTSLSIALWLTCSLWIVGAIAYATGAPEELVWATFIVGVVAGVLEWYARRGADR